MGNGKFCLVPLVPPLVSGVLGEQPWVTNLVRHFWTQILLASEPLVFVRNLRVIWVSQQRSDFTLRLLFLERRNAISIPVWDVCATAKNLSSEALETGPISLILQEPLAIITWTITIYHFFHRFSVFPTNYSILVIIDSDGK